MYHVAEEGTDLSFIGVGELSTKGHALHRWKYGAQGAYQGRKLRPRNSGKELVVEAELKGWQ